MCKKQTCVSHSSPESEIISLDAGLRMDAIPTLDLWDLIIDVMHSKSNQKQNDKQARGDPLHGKVSEKRVNLQCNTQVSQRHLELSNVVFFLNVTSCHKRHYAVHFLKTTKL